jgi:tetratricopeptide (TPR) repeat protein
MGKRWTEADLRFLRDNADKMDVQSLADRLEARIDEVEGKIEKLGLQAPESAPGKPMSSLRELSRHSEAARKEYEKGVAGLQKKKYEEAERHFRALIGDFSDEKELADRARLYLAICEKHNKISKTPAPEAVDAYYAALLEKNRGNYDAALEHLRKVQKKNGDGRSSFLQACCYARMNETEKALELLKRAIAEDETNRALARRDPDFESVREHPEFQSVTAATA